MALGAALSLHRGELRADFQRYYGIDIDRMGPRGALRAADLAVHLPPGSALSRATNPELAWSSTDYLLWAIEYDLRTLMWALSGGKKSDRPKPLETPADGRKRRAPRASRAEMDRVADRLGIPAERR